MDHDFTVLLTCYILLSMIVYLTVGAAIPSVVEAILVSLMNDTFEGAYRKLMQVVEEKL